MLYDGKATDVLTVRPACDLCDAPAIVDGATVNGPWAYMCVRHFSAFGRGLGMGVGQVLLCGDGMDDTLREGFNESS